MPLPKSRSKSKSAGKSRRKTAASKGVLVRRLQIRTRQGLHARPAALFVQVANRFRAVIRVRKGRREVDGKSIMGLLTLAAAKGSALMVIVKGPDAAEALRALEQVVSRTEVPALVTVVKHGPGP